MNKPITLTALKDLINQYDKEDITLSRFKEILNEIALQWHSEQSGWIKCSDRFPTTFLETYNGTKSNLLVLLDDQGNTCIGRFFIQYYDGGKIESFWNEFEDEITGVTHYIELPVLP